MMMFVRAYGTSYLIRREAPFHITHLSWKMERRSRRLEEPMPGGESRGRHGKTVTPLACQPFAFGRTALADEAGDVPRAFARAWRRGKVNPQA